MRDLHKMARRITPYRQTRRRAEMPTRRPNEFERPDFDPRPIAGPSASLGGGAIDPHCPVHGGGGAYRVAGRSPAGRRFSDESLSSGGRAPRRIMRAPQTRDVETEAWPRAGGVDPDCPVHGMRRSGGRSLRSPRSAAGRDGAGLLNICVSTRVTRSRMASRLQDWITAYVNDPCVTKNEVSGAAGLISQVQDIQRKIAQAPISGETSSVDKDCTSFFSRCPGELKCLPDPKNTGRKSCQFPV